MVHLLPEAFLERMKVLLGEEFLPFAASYNEPRSYGLRVNKLKISVDEFRRLSPFALKPIPWVNEGFYYEEGKRPGKHPYYHAGLYYIQEPSAMAPVELLDVRPGEKVLDLCAAPGGKSTQIAAKLEGTGLLVTNDNHADRVKALVKNIELSGVRNATVLNETPEGMAVRFRGFFDKILVDAPCSGEGMFRKEEEMAKSWERHSVEKCMLMQRSILSNAAHLLASGGTIVYSTCTFSPEENEGMIAEFLDNHPQFDVHCVPPEAGFSPGRADWIRMSRQGQTQTHGEGGQLPRKDDPLQGEASQQQVDSQTLSDKAIEATKGTARLWPHRIHGEGHYIAVLRHNGKGAEQTNPVHSEDKHCDRKKHSRVFDSKKTDSADLAPFFQFMKDQLTASPKGKVVVYGTHLYLVSELLPDLSGINVARPGWYVGRLLKSNRFEPSHALALALGKMDAVRVITLSSDSMDAIRYLKGETLEIAENRIEKHGSSVNSKGYCMVAIDGFSVGWGKWLDGMLKNEYPPGWRWT